MPGEKEKAKVWPCEEGFVTIQVIPIATTAEELPTAYIDDIVHIRIRTQKKRGGVKNVMSSLKVHNIQLVIRAGS